MAFTTTRSAGELILEHSTNVVDNPRYLSYTDKPWARPYAPILRESLSIHSTICQDQTVAVNFDSAFLPLNDDEEGRRTSEPASPPNTRFWRLENEADAEHWWHAEVSDIVLAAWAQCPQIVETCHTQPLTPIRRSETVDTTYGIYINRQRSPAVIGEMKRNLINGPDWQGRNLPSAQQKLARELRGYADRYQCPLIFCWDGETLLVLQFRARTLEHIRHPDCPIDCWVIPVSGARCTLRYALYRVLVQGFRRCQAVAAVEQLRVGSLAAHGREFFTGRPIWRTGGVFSTEHPEGYVRSVDGATGALYWSHPTEEEGLVWETPAFW